MPGKRKDSRGRVLREGESQRGNGGYQYRYTDSSKKRRYLYASTLDELRAKEEKLTRDILDGIDYAQGQTTLQELEERYLEQKTMLKKNTLSSYKHIMGLIDRYGLAKRQINTIKKSDIVSLMVRMHNDGLKYSTIYSTKAFVFSVLEIAVDDDVIRKNPAKVKIQNYIKNDCERVKALTPEQAASFLEFVKYSKYYKKYYDIYIILLETGLRISELCGLTLNDVDFENRCIHITHQLLKADDGTLYIETPKSSAGTRDVPMSETARAAFARVIAKNANSKRDRMQHIIDGRTGFLFLNKDGRPRCGDGIASITKRAADEYNSLYGENLRITPHVFRHTFCTNLSNARVSIKSIMYVMGHSSPEMVAIYDDVSYDVVERELRERVIGE